MSGNNDNDNPIAMIPCNDCGKMIPEMNMTIHKLHACQGTQAAATNQQASDNNNNNNNNDPMEIDDDEDDQIVNGMQASTSNSISSNNSNEEILQVGDFVDLVNIHSSQESSPRVAPAATFNASNDNDNNNNNQAETSDTAATAEEEADDSDKWACPRCTLINASIDPRCDACQLPNPNAPQRQRQHFNMNSSSSSSSSIPANHPLAFLSGGALFGGVLGAAGSLMRGRNVMSGAAEGAVSGAVGGAFLQEVLRSNGTNHDRSNNNNNNNNTRDTLNNISSPTTSVSQARTSVTMGMPGYPSMSSNHDSNNNDDSRLRQEGSENINSSNNNNNNNASSNATRQRPRSSYRVVRQRDPTTGMRTTIISGGGNGSTRIIQHRFQLGGNTNNNNNDNASRNNANNNNNNNNNDNNNNTNAINVDDDDDDEDDIDNINMEDMDPFISLLMHSMMQRTEGEGGGPNNMQQVPFPFRVVGGGNNNNNNNNIDNMTYEQLLQAFGSGNDHLGASIEEISQLPTATITNPEKELPGDAKQCSICLEEFESGHVRKTLPCLHGFHVDCADKWLRTNGSCPICKHRLNE